MGMVLHFGVNDIPYTVNPRTAPLRPLAKPSRRVRKPRQLRLPFYADPTTGDVAEWLERRYHVMEFFAKKYEAKIGDLLADSMRGAIENLMLGAPASNNPFGTAESKIEETFRKFLDNREMDGQPGVPTKASLKGVSLRFKRKRGPVRPSFIDSGQYQTNMRAWMSGG
jgi:hypothetical protein